MTRFESPIIITYICLETFYSVQCVPESIVSFDRQIDRRLNVNVYLYKPGQVLRAREV
jgi:hypothetical protein